MAKHDYKLPSHKWVTYILFNNTGKVHVHKIYFNIIVDIFHQNAFADNRRGDSKLRTYAYLKTEIGKEPYLEKIQT